MIFRKLTVNDVEARVQSCDEYGFTLLLYKNARVDQNILDETFTPFGWQNKYEEFKGNMYCSIGIQDEKGEWIWKSNCGTESNTEKEKGEASDSFKRAGFNWGIGRELYTAPKTKIKGHTKQVDRNGRAAWIPEYYAFDVVEMEVSDEMPRRITALTIIGKSMEGGYHEDEIFSWKDKKAPFKQQPTKQQPKTQDSPKATPIQQKVAERPMPPRARLIKKLNEMKMDVEKYAKEKGLNKQTTDDRYEELLEELEVAERFEAIKAQGEGKCVN